MVYPGGQVHVKLPGVFVQVAMGPQPPLFTAHSSISATSSQVSLGDDCDEVICAG